MGDGLKLSKEKRHRSSGSIAEAALDGTRSERKLDIKASIPEVEDQFAVADLRCAHLQEKIDQVQELRRRKKLKKRSLTHMSDQTGSDDVPMIRVRTVPKKKVSQQASRMRRLEEPPAPRVSRRAAPAHVREPQRMSEATGVVNVARAARRNRADGGDNACSRGNQIASGLYAEAACGGDLDDSDRDYFDPVESVKKESHKSPNARRRHTPRDTIKREVTKGSDDWNGNSVPSAAAARAKNILNRKKPAPPRAQWIGPEDVPRAAPEERPVLELYNKSRGSPSPPQLLSPRKKATARDTEVGNDLATGPLETFKMQELQPKESRTGERRRIRRGRRYEMPTVASQMKQAGMRYCYRRSNHTDLPFVVSKSTTPSHNIGVNLQQIMISKYSIGEHFDKLSEPKIQDCQNLLFGYMDIFNMQVLNGLKIQQPLSGIPMTIAHHMGLRHLPFQAKSSEMAEPENNREMNVIKVGRKFVRLPSFRCISYNRLLALYREGDGVVPRYLRAASRPHYFYTSMYNLTSTTRDDFDGSTSKGRGGGGRVARQSLAEYASLYRQYEQLEQRLQRGDEGEGAAESQRRRDDLARELAAREEHIRRIVQEYDATSLRASASAAEDTGRRRSAFRLDMDSAPPQ